MTSNIRLWTGLALVVVGLLWTAQGLGLVGGSVMSGVALWALIGPVVAIAGVLVVLRWQRDRG